MSNRKPCVLTITVAAGLCAASTLLAGETVCDSVGPDLITGEIQNWSNYPSVGDIDAFSVGSTVCNIGDEIANWIADTDDHPIIAQTMFRLKDGRFEQVGQSWVKHGFGAAQQNGCGCGCIPADFSHLGIGCSDPYGAGINGSQATMGPKFEVNADTGKFLFPPADFGETGDTIYKRLQVHKSDLDPNQNGGGQYFVEIQYIHPGDAAADNGHNNNSWRVATLSESDGEWEIALEGPTHREEPAIMAWKAMDDSVTIETIDILGEGRLLLGWTGTSLGNGQWSYEFALQNQNSDRAVGSVRFNLPTAASVSDPGFHDVDYHSGEPFVGDDWATTVGAGQVSWSTEAHKVNPNANALRWGTTYNFRFVADVPPWGLGSVELVLFKPGSPYSLFVHLNAPVQCPADLDGDFEVATSDLLALLAAWETPGGDITGDGNTDTADLLALLAAWGACE